MDHFFFAFLSKPRTFLSDPKLLNGSVCLPLKRFLETAEVGRLAVGAYVPHPDFSRRLRLKSATFGLPLKRALFPFPLTTGTSDCWRLRRGD